jgi:hypothetical protein
MWKMIKIYKDDKEFIAWTKRIEKKLKGEVLSQFKESWPKVRTNNEAIKGSFVYYWEMRSGAGQIHNMAQPMSIGYLAYLADGAHAAGREDIIEVLNNMIMNIPRINMEITNGLVTKIKSDESTEGEVEDEEKGL